MFGPGTAMTTDDPTDHLRDCQELRLAWREATSDWLEARRQYERLQAGNGTDPRRLQEAAQTYAFAAHRRSLLYRDVEQAAEALDAFAHLRTLPASAR